LRGKADEAKLQFARAAQLDLTPKAELVHQSRHACMSAFGARRTLQVTDEEVRWNTSVTHIER
jgi:hypothetical protein